MASMVLRLLFNILCFIDRHQYIQLTDKTVLHFLFYYTVYINGGCIYSFVYPCNDRREDAGLSFGVIEASAY